MMLSSLYVYVLYLHLNGLRPLAALPHFNLNQIFKVPFVLSGVIRPDDLQSSFPTQSI